MTLVDDFERALLSLDRLAARQILSASDATGASIERVERLVIPALERIGEGWERGTLSLSQVYMSGRICEELVNAILPPGHPSRTDQPKMAVTVLQDHHLLGKRIVYSVLQASGFELLDYGRTDVDGLVRRALADGVEVLLISTLMLSSALCVKEVHEGLDRAGARVKIVVGGAPFRFDDQLWREVGADAMGRDASEAVDIVSRFAGGG
jgi:methanogenic corrinoid protein MtbC1